MPIERWNVIGLAPARGNLQLATAERNLDRHGLHRLARTFWPRASGA